MGWREFWCLVFRGLGYKSVGVQVSELRFRDYGVELKSRRVRSRSTTSSHRRSRRRHRYRRRAGGHGNMPSEQGKNGCLLFFFNPWSSPRRHRLSTNNRHRRHTGSKTTVLLLTGKPKAGEAGAKLEQTLKPSQVE